MWKFFSYKCCDTTSTATVTALQKLPGRKLFPVPFQHQLCFFLFPSYISKYILIQLTIPEEER